jgi:hypothetical protein
MVVPPAAASKCRVSKRAKVSFDSESLFERLFMTSSFLPCPWVDQVPQSFAGREDRGLV